MSTEKDKFSQLVEEKLKDFEVPYNETHWQEMSDKLDKMGPTANPSNSIISGKTLWIAAAGVALISAVYLLNESESETAEMTDSVVVEQPIHEDSKTEIAIQNDGQKEVSVDAISPDVEADLMEEESGISEKGAEELVEKYNEMSEQSVKEESKTFVNQAVEKQKQTFKNEPMIDNPELKTEIIVDANVLCVGDEISFGVDREISHANYNWDFGDKGLTSRKVSPKHKFKKAGTYAVRLLVSQGEKNDYKAEKMITVMEKPDIDIDWENKQITLNDPYLQFEAESNTKCDFTWTFDDKLQGKGNIVEYDIPDGRYYPIELTAVAENGCAVKISDTYHTNKGWKMHVGDAFTPNGDGNNDDFMPEELKGSSVEFNLVIRDKGGDQVFESNDAYNAWNGKVNNLGNPLPEGRYFWQVSFKDDRGKVHKQEGKISILR